MEGVDYIQTTAPVSEGSSGGGRFDDRGNLIGITTSTVRGAQNLLRNRRVGILEMIVTLRAAFTREAA